MPEVWIFVVYDGKWVETAKKFVDQKWKSISVPADMNYERLLERMYLAVGKNSNDYRLTMKIDTCTADFQYMDVSNDDDVRFFMSLVQLGKPCPLYVSTERREEEPGIGFSGTNHFLDVSCEPLKQKCLEIFQEEGYAIRRQYQGQSRWQCGSRESEGKDVHKGPTIKIGKSFIDVGSLYWELSVNAILGKFQFVLETCSSDVLVVRCLDEKCKWRVRANKSSCDESFKVVENDNAHTCSRENIRGEHRQVTRWIVEQLTWNMYDVPGLVYKPDVIVLYIQFKLGVQISLGKASKARQYVLDMFKNSPEGLYSFLPSYCAVLSRINPGTVIDILINNENRFKYLFMALYASIRGWLACRPVIAIDATSLEAYGMLIAVTCKDGNDQIFPLAFGIVDSENNESWVWFLTKFKEAFGDRDSLVVISKHTESVRYALDKAYPEIEHYICLQHLLQEVNAKFKELEIEPLVKSASETYHFSEFVKLMYDICCVDTGVHDYLFQAGCKKWARVYFSGNRYNIMRTDIAEFLNETAEKVGHLATLAVVGHLTLTLHDLFSKRRKEASKMTSNFTKWAEDALRYRSINSISMKVSCCENGEFDVIDGPQNATVDLRAKTCTCRVFELDQMLCSHALAVLREIKMSSPSFYLFCSHYYTRECLEQTYAESIHPPFMSKWNESEKVVYKVLPPTTLWSGVRTPLKKHQFFDEDDDNI